MEGPKSPTRAFIGGKGEPPKRRYRGERKGCPRREQEERGVQNQGSTAIKKTRKEIPGEF